MDKRGKLQSVEAWLQNHRVINASGTMTSLGASIVPEEVADIIKKSLSYFIDMGALQAYASDTISRLTGAEAGCVTASAAAGIAVAAAACMTGTDLGAAEALPDTNHLERKYVIIQKGHVVNYGASVTQNLRLTGAHPVEIGTATHSETYQLRHALTKETAAAIYVVSHHTVQSEQISLPDFIAACHEAGVPVIVDAASEYDLETFTKIGADIVIYSGHKFLGGATSGIIAGRRDLVHACHMHQTVGIGRPMKVGKEGVVSVIAALTRWETLDHKALHAQEYENLSTLKRAIGTIDGFCVQEHADPTGNPITRLRIQLDPTKTSAPLELVVEALAQGTPPLIVRSHHVDLGFFELDPCNLVEGDVALIIERFENVASLLRDYPPVAQDMSYGPRRSAYTSDGLPTVNLARVPWGFRRTKDTQAVFDTWPDTHLAVDSEKTGVDE